MDENCLKGWMYKGYKYFPPAKNGWKWLGIAESVLEINVNG